jgi:hypothetical protein
MRYSAFYQIVDGIVDELQVMVWPGETTPRRRLKNEQLETAFLYGIVPIEKRWLPFIWERTIIKQVSIMRC